MLGSRRGEVLAGPRMADIMQAAERVGADMIQLAHEPAFAIGALVVDPPTRSVSLDGRRARLEPRVMQVLVRLARAEGAVVSRDQLIASCWNGRIVGDNAVNRVISLVRSLGGGLANGAFELETIAKVGYRLTAADVSAGVEGPVRPANPLTRRRAIAVGAVTAAVAGAGAFSLWRRRRKPSAAARDLYRKGLDAQRQGLPDQTSQAVSYLEEAVRTEPTYADAWGALALSYRHRLESDPTVDQAVVAGWITAAADRALQLDPSNADAEVARIMIRPNYRNWLAVDAAYRSELKRHPNHWLLRGTFGRLMYSVGRWEDGLAPFRANVAADPFLPVSRLFLAQGLWHAGRWQEAEATIESAFVRWPTHPAIWFLRFYFLAHTGRPAAARAFAANLAGRPLGIAEDRFAGLEVTGRALETGAPEDLTAAIGVVLAGAARSLDDIPRAVQTLSALGALDSAFALTDRYFLERSSGGTPAAKIGPLTRRDTDFLFAQPAAALRADPRFGALIQTIGLEGYWRASRSTPDYRRAVQPLPTRK